MAISRSALSPDLLPGNSEFPTLQDYISLFPLDDMQPSKLMRLLSSNEEDATILSSPSECARRAGGHFLSGELAPAWTALHWPPAAGFLAGWSGRV